LFLAGRLDIDVEYVNDCKRLAKQCRLQDLIDDLETKCKKVYEFGKRFTCCCLCCACVSFQGERGKCGDGCFMVLLRLPENDSVVEFPCLHDSFQSRALCRAAVVVSDTCMFIIYTECFRYSRAAMAAGLCCGCQTVSGPLWGILRSASQQRACLNPRGDRLCTTKSPFLHLSDP